MARLDLRLSKRGTELRDAMIVFVRECVLPAEGEYYAHRASDPGGHDVPPIIEQLKLEARSRGLWNLFLPDQSHIGQLDYAAIAEVSGWSLHLAPEAINCQAPDTGNMELLHLFGSPDQRQRWLAPLLDGSIRSAFAMTEPAVASSDATNVMTSMIRDGDSYVINGRKWWTTGAADPRCQLLIVMGKTNPETDQHRQQSMMLIPMDAPGVRVVRDVPVFGHHDQHGHCEVEFTDVRVPISALLGSEGDGFMMAQARLGPGRIHHCMRALGAAERALALLVRRAHQRTAFGGPLIERETIQRDIAESRMAIEQARMLCLSAAKTIDDSGNKAAATLVAMAKVAVPRAALSVIDRAIQVHGAAGVSDDYPLAAMWGWHRAMRIFDGPDEVHLRAVARRELRATALFETSAIGASELA